MQTLIEYVIAQYLGPPRRIKGNGESYWYCPKCRGHNFHTFPVHPKYKQYADCPKCKIREDVLGILGEFHSGRYVRWQHVPDFGDRRTILERMEATFKVTQPQPQPVEQRRGTRSTTVKPIIKKSKR